MRVESDPDAGVPFVTVPFFPFFFPFFFPCSVFSVRARFCRRVGRG